MELPEHCEAFFDPAAIDRVFANLMSNAIKFTPAGGRIGVRVERRDGEIYLEVRDSGVGIDPEFRKRMFGRFEQGRAAVRAGASGSGIGLAIVKELIEAHGGSIRVEDNRGGGSVFQVLLPMDGGPLAHAQGVERSSIRRISAPVMFPSAPAPAPAPQVPTGALGATILVAEDDPALRQAVVDVLSSHYRVLSAPDGLAALEIAKAKLPDMLVTDIGMPGMDGIELTRRFRELSGVRLAPVLVLTAYGTVGDRLLGFEAGAIDYVLKPFEPGELLARVRAQLAIRDMALRMHDLEKLAALGTMLSGLAHEFRNPANAVVNALGPIKEMLDNPDPAMLEMVGQLLDIAVIGATQINALSRQLLGFVHPGEMIFAAAPVPELLHSAIVLVPNLDNIKLEQHLAFAGDIQCNRSMVIQILTNLLDNAAYAAGPRGSVRISCSQQDGMAMIDVKDSGPGIPAELRERIFEPFFTTKPPGSGTGLGLSVSRRIAQRHGGDLRVLGSGPDTVFRLQLPITGPARPGSDAPHLAGSPGEASPGYPPTAPPVLPLALPFEGSFSHACTLLSESRRASPPPSAVSLDRRSATSSKKSSCIARLRGNAAFTCAATCT